MFLLQFLGYNCPLAVTFGKIPLLIPQSSRFITAESYFFGQFIYLYAGCHLVLSLLVTLSFGCFWKWGVFCGSFLCLDFSWFIFIY